MTKELHCRDLGFDCDAVVTGDAEDDILAQVVDHGQQVHHIAVEELSDPEFAAKARSVIRDVDVSMGGTAS